MAQGAAFAIGVPPDIYAFHCYTRNSTPSLNSSLLVTDAVPRLSPGVHTCLSTPPAHALRPVIPINAHPTYYRGCWHADSRCLFFRYRQSRVARTISSLTKVLYNRKPSSHTRHCWIRLSPIVQDSPATSRRSLGRVSVPVWYRPLRPATDRSLGRRYPTNKLIRHRPLQ